MSIHIQISKDKLLEHLTRVCSIVEKRVDFPSLGFILFEFSGNQLQLTSSNMSIELSTTFDLDDSVSDDYAILVPARKLLNLCRNIQDDAIKLNFTAKDLKINTPQGNFKLATMAKDQFPLIEFNKSADSLELSTKTLLQAIRYTRNFMAPEPSRAVLQGVYFELAGKNLVAVATDGHRMSYFQSAIDASTDTQFILPARSINELSNHLDPDVDISKMEYKDGYVRFENNKFTLTTRLVDGSYPDFRAVVPEQEGSFCVCLAREELLAVLKTIKVLINESTQSVLCEFSKDKLTIKTHNNETDEGECVIDITYTGEPISIVFNINYIFDVLHSINSKDVEIHLQDSNKSCLMKKTEEEESFANEIRFVVMPMRI